MSELQYQVVSFDLDGTLVDSAAEIAEAANRTLEEHGIGRRPVDQIERLIGAGTRELMLKLLAHVMLEDGSIAHVVSIDAVLASMDRHYAQTSGSSAIPYPGCLEAMQSLKDAGVRLTCVTNKEAKHAVRVLQSTRLDGFFELLIGGDTLDEKKPHASVLRHVLSALGGDAERMAHVGDSFVDVEAARNAGVAAWAVPYGYNAGRPIVDAKPEKLFDSLADVARHVLTTPAFIPKAVAHPLARRSMSTGLVAEP